MFLLSIFYTWFMLIPGTVTHPLFCIKLTFVGRKEQELSNKEVIMKIFKILFMTASVIFMTANLSAYAEIEFDFEHGNQGWSIPEWTIHREDYVGKLMEISSDKFMEQNSAIKLMCDFPRKSWAAAIVEFEAKTGLEAKNVVSADIYIPGKARRCELKARIIITVGPDWKVMEGKFVHLEHGQWNKVAADFDDFTLKAGGGSDQNSSVSIEPESIKKIAIRIEREATPWNPLRRYKGPVYIDNVTVGK